MSFTYYQGTGKLINDDTNELVGTGYSGNGEGLNNPQMQDKHAIGPVPQGEYHIAEPKTDSKVGVIAMRLIPYQTNEMFGRADFLIHGDNKAENHTASEGCIILSHSARVEIGNEVLTGNFLLKVVA